MLCGGTHIYPGPRLLNHLINTHGVLQNIEFIIQASQYMNTYSRLPPLTEESSKSSNNQTTQAGEMLFPPNCTECPPFDDKMKTSTPIRQNSHLKEFQLQSPGHHFSTPARSHSVISHIEHQEFKKDKCDQNVSVHEVDEVAAIEAKEDGNKPDELPTRSGFRCICALCGYVTTDDTSFWGHITKKHKMSFQLYKSEHGSSQFPTGSGKFQCLVCQDVVKHMPGSVDKHMKARHQMNWNQYLDWVRVNKRKNSDQKQIGLDVKPKVNSVANDPGLSQPLTLGEQTVKNSRPLNIRDKSTKHCTQCKIFFPSRNSFLVHCQQVHKLRFKSKSGESLSFQQSGTTAAVALNMSANQLPKSSPVPRNLQQSPSSQPRKRSEKTASCQYCQKIFVSVSNRDRHVRLHCSGAAGDGVEVNEAVGDIPGQFEGVKEEVKDR